MWQTKYASTIHKNLGVRLNFRQCSEDFFLSGRGFSHNFYFKFSQKSRIKMQTNHKLYFLLQFRRIHVLLWSYWQHCQFRKQQQISGICLWSRCWIVRCCFDTHCPKCHWKKMDSNHNVFCVLLVFNIFRGCYKHRWVFVFFLFVFNSIKVSPIKGVRPSPYPIGVPNS